MTVEIKILGETAVEALKELADLATGLTRSDIGNATSVVAIRAVGDAGQTYDPATEEYIATGVADIAKTEADAPAANVEAPKRTRKTKAKETPAPAPQAISTGEERVGPDDEQDAADEAADPDNAASGDALTHEDLRKALADYSKKHGMKAAVAAVKADGIIGCTVDQVPVERIADVISDLVNHSVTNTPRAGEANDPRQTEDASAKLTGSTPVPAYEPTKTGLMNAMLAYALKYDGTDDVSKASMATMPATMTDAPLIFAMRFGEAVNSLSKVPADGYAQAILDVQEATEKNPFNREVK